MVSRHALNTRHSAHFLRGLDTQGQLDHPNLMRLNRQQQKIPALTAFVHVNARTLTAVPVAQMGTAGDMKTL